MIYHIYVDQNVQLERVKTTSMKKVVQWYSFKVKYYMRGENKANNDMLFILQYSNV